MLLTLNNVECLLVTFVATVIALGLWVNGTRYLATRTFKPSIQEIHRQAHYDSSLYSVIRDRMYAVHYRKFLYETTAMRYTTYFLIIWTLGVMGYTTALIIMNALGYVTFE